MGARMSRGKQQILFNYLPERTFDFEKLALIAQVTKISGVVRTDLNSSLLLRKISAEVTAWKSEFRPAFRDEILSDTSRFVFLEPMAVSARMFPRLLWCQSGTCGRLVDAKNFENLPHKCPTCNTGKLIQVRFVKIHRCGALEPLNPPFCSKCKSSWNISLDTRGGERISNFLWTCEKCHSKVPLIAGPCHACQWPIQEDGPRVRDMQIEVHRAGRTYYGHSTVLLNIPDRQFDDLLARAEWPAVVASKYLELPETAGRSLIELSQLSSPRRPRSPGELTNHQLDSLFQRQSAGEITAEQMVAEMQKMRMNSAGDVGEEGRLIQAVVGQSGVAWTIWEEAAYELLETLLPANGLISDSPRARREPPTGAFEISKRMGFNSIVLEDEFPIVTATYGYSRAEYKPSDCRLNPFPPDRDHGGKFPIFVDQVQADAIIVRLNIGRVIRWLELNGYTLPMPASSSPDISQKSAVVRLFGSVALHETITHEAAPARLAFGLLHTLSHLSVRRAALLCGLDHTSLSEYLFPRSLSYAIYCNHRFGATIGALTSLFEQTASEWLSSIESSNKCVYDPVCKETNGNCHACVHLAETSCRFFNLNLNRAFLFGGKDPQLGQIRYGYFAI
jgi:hypothetical protein